MKKSLCLALIPFLCTPKASAAEVLRLVADVRDENLAEEALILTHCLAERTGATWELDGAAGGASWLRVREEGSSLRGVYHRAEKEVPFSLTAGSADETCARLEPAAASLAPPAPAASPPPAFPPGGELEPDESPRHAWAWVAAGAVLAGGFLLWKSRRPDYGSVEMR